MTHFDRPSLQRGVETVDNLRRQWRSALSIGDAGNNVGVWRAFTATAHSAIYSIARDVHKTSAADLFLHINGPPYQRETCNATLAHGFEQRQVQRAFRRIGNADTQTGNEARQRLFPAKKSKANGLFA